MRRDGSTRRRASAVVVGRRAGAAGAAGTARRVGATPVKAGAGALTVTDADTAAAVTCTAGRDLPKAPLRTAKSPPPTEPSALRSPVAKEIPGPDLPKLAARSAKSEPLT